MYTQEGRTNLEGAGLIAALVIVAAWLAMLSWLAFRTAATEVEWARLFSILSSLEAVAFAAAGALFGTAIQRQRVQEARERAEKAEERAAGAEKSATSNAQAAVNGRALATAVKARAGARGRAAEGAERVSAGGGAKDDLAALAEQLFPE
ncbi:MAG: hypothetical protein ACRD7E_23435 [Bryobacteraceae bacterium]